MLLYTQGSLTCPSEPSIDSSTNLRFKALPSALPSTSVANSLKGCYYSSIIFNFNQAFNLEPFAQGYQLALNWSYCAGMTPVIFILDSPPSTWIPDFTCQHILSNPLNLFTNTKDVPSTLTSYASWSSGFPGCDAAVVFREATHTAARPASRKRAVAGLFIQTFIPSLPGFKKPPPTKSTNQPFTFRYSSAGFGTVYSLDLKPDSGTNYLVQVNAAAFELTLLTSLRFRQHRFKSPSRRLNILRMQFQPKRHRAREMRSILCPSLNFKPLPLCFSSNAARIGPVAGAYLPPSLMRLINCNTIVPQHIRQLVSIQRASSSFISSA
ncbi:hypothetical protein B0H14DRAFT_2569200 [Mycena olivaceomarginata]|nr:hypothetical protein B0H14DRAFT_2569200 [Mycena olivaceomarginata]